MKDISQVEDIDCLKYAIGRELKSNGIKIPKEKKSNQPEHGSIAGVFGSRLGYLPSLIVDHETGCTVPKFLVEAVAFLEKHLKCEGLFRKSGSHSRQRELKQHIQDGGAIPDSAHVYDVASLFKQFFRELSEPLLTNRLHDTFMKCQQLEDSQERQYTVLLSCSLLPLSHLHSLKYIMTFLKRVSENSEANKMDIGNISLVLAPNLMANIEKNEKLNTAAEKLRRTRTQIVEQLIWDADKIGLIPDSVLTRMSTLGVQSENFSCDGLTSEDDLDRSTEVILEKKKWKRKKRRSGSISGIVSGLGQSLGLLKSSSSNTVKTPASSAANTPAFFDNNAVHTDYIASPHDSVVPVGETPTIRRSAKRKAHEDMGSFSAAKRKAMLHQMTSDPKYSKQGIHIHKGTPGSLGTPMTPLRAPSSAIGDSSAATELFGFLSPSIKYADDSMASISSSPSVKVLDESADLLLDSTLTPSKQKSKMKLKKIKRRSSSNAGSGCFSPRNDNKRRSIRLRLRQRSASVQGTPTKSHKEDTVGWRLANAQPRVGLDTLDFNMQQKQPTAHSTSSTPAEDKKTKGLFRKHKKVPSSPGRLLSESTLSKSSAANDSVVIENPQILQPPSPLSKYRVKSHLTQVKKIDEQSSSSPKVVTVDVCMQSPTSTRRIRSHSGSRAQLNATVTSKPPAPKPSGQKHKMANTRSVVNLKPPSPIQLKKEQLARQARSISMTTDNVQLDSSNKTKEAKSEHSSSELFVRPKPVVKSSRSLPEESNIAKVHLPSKTKPGIETNQGRPILTASVSLPEALDRVADMDCTQITRSASCQSVSSILSALSANDRFVEIPSPVEKPSPEPVEMRLFDEAEPMSVDEDVATEKSSTAEVPSGEPMIGDQEGEVAVNAETFTKKIISKSVSIDSGKGRSMFDLTEIDNRESKSAEVEVKESTVSAMECESSQCEQRNISLGSIDSAIDTTMVDEAADTPMEEEPHDGPGNKVTTGESEMGKSKCEEGEHDANVHQDASTKEEFDKVVLPCTEEISLKKDSCTENRHGEAVLSDSCQSNEENLENQSGQNAMVGHTAARERMASVCSDSNIKESEAFIDFDDSDDFLPGRLTKCYTLPERRPPRREASSSSVDSGLVQRHIKHFNSITKTEITSPLRVSKGPLAFRRAPGRASARFARDDDTGLDQQLKSLKRMRSDQTIMKKPKIPITSTLVKSMSTDSGLSRLTCDTSYVTGAGDFNRSYEEAIASSIRHVSSTAANIKIPKALQETIDDVCTPRNEKLVKTPLQDNNTAGNVQGKLTPMKTLPNKFPPAPHSLTPLHLASKTKIRLASGKTSSAHKPNTPVKPVRHLTPSRSPSVKLDLTKGTPTDREMKKYKKSPRYPKSPRSPAKPVVGSKMAMFPYRVAQDF